MIKPYDEYRYQELRSHCESAISKMNDLALLQYYQIRFVRTVVKGSIVYQQLRKKIKRTRAQLRAFNKHINRFYDFCDKYSELRRFGHI